MILDITKVLFAFLILLSMPGCTTPGQQLEPAAISQLHQGQSQDEVRKIFGTPAESTTGSNGKRLDVFQVVFYKNMSGGIRTVDIRSLHVLYDAQGHVEKFLSHVGEIKGFVGNSYRNQKWTAGRPLSSDKLNNIQRRLTTHDELVDIFGPAEIEGLDVEGNRGARWFFFEGKKQGETHRYELAVIFDTNLVVRDFLIRNLKD